MLREISKRIGTLRPTVRFPVSASCTSRLMDWSILQILRSLASCCLLWTGMVKPQDGFLRLHDIYNLRLNADLVVLSACETALGSQVNGEGVMSLSRGFFYAGAARVVASLWTVDDRATAKLMGDFYRNMLSNKMSPAAALRAAQKEMQKSHDGRLPTTGRLSNCRANGNKTRLGTRDNPVSKGCSKNFRRIAILPPPNMNVCVSDCRNSFNGTAAASRRNFADRTLDRLARRLEAGEQIEPVYSYCCGIGRMLLLEAHRERERHTGALNQWASSQSAPSDPEETHYSQGTVESACKSSRSKPRTLCWITTREISSP